MLTRSSNISSPSTIQPAENLYSLQGYWSDVHSDPPSFPSPENDSTEKENEQKSELANSERELQEGKADIRELFPKHNFQEMLSRFFVHGHRQLLAIRLELRTERKAGEVITLTGIPKNAKGIHAVRKIRYQLQMVLFHSQKGGHFNHLL